MPRASTSCATQPPALPEDRRYQLDLADVAEVWRRGSVISSWLLDLTAIALAEDPELREYSGNVEDSGEGRWTIKAAIEEAVPAEVLSAALYARFRSRQDHTFADKLLSAMRKDFGGHVEPPRAKPMTGAHDSGRPSAARPPGAALHAGDLRRLRRSDQAAADPVALQSGAGPPAAGALP